MLAEPIGPYATLETADQLRAYLALLCQIRVALGTFYSAFPVELLGDPARQALKPLLFPDVQEFVSLVAEAIADQPALFRHVPVDPERLALRQEVADALRAVRCHLGLLHRLCGDTFLQVQAGAVAEARDVIARVQAEGALPFNPDPDLEERQLALAVPASLLPQRGRPPGIKKT
jgi:hypothetical protein